MRLKLNAQHPARRVPSQWRYVVLPSRSKHMVSARSTTEKIMTYNNTPLEVQFGLEQVILGVRIVASMTSVDLVIGAPVSCLVSTIIKNET